MSSGESEARCTLHGALGRVEVCPGAQCPLWDRVENACVLHDIQFEILFRPAVAEHLLELRNTLEAARP